MPHTQIADVTEISWESLVLDPTDDSEVLLETSAGSSGSCDDTSNSAQQTASCD